MDNWMQTYRGVIHTWEYDGVGHMNSRLYVSRFDQATWSLVSAIGLTPSFFRQHDRRLAIVREEMDFRRELRGGEIIEVRSGFLEVRKRAMRIIHRMLDAETGEEIATGDFTGVQADLSTRKSIPLAEEVKARARDYLVERASS